jgi:general secretion pathway protein E
VGKTEEAGAADRRKMFASEHSEFGRYLVANGKLADAALERAERARADENERLEVVLSRLGLISERDLAQSLSAFLDIPLATSNDFPKAPIVEDKLGRKFLRERHLIPIDDHADAIVLAMAYPLDTYAVEAVRFAVGKQVLRKVAVPSWHWPGVLLVGRGDRCLRLVAAFSSASG